MRASDRIKNLTTRCAESGATSATVEIRGPYSDRRGYGLSYVVSVALTCHPFGETDHPDWAFPLRSEFNCRTLSGARRTARALVRACAAGGIDPARITATDSLAL